MAPRDMTIRKAYVEQLMLLRDKLEEVIRAAESGITPNAGEITMLKMSIKQSHRLEKLVVADLAAEAV